VGVPEETWLENKVALVITPAVVVPEEDLVGKKLARRLVAVVVLPEEDQTWLENEMARRLVCCRLEYW